MSLSTEPRLIQYLHSKGIEKGLPVSGTFELTSRCNFKCEMCYVHSENNNVKEISADEWISLGEEAKKAGTLFLLLTGGEPLILKDFERIYRELNNMGFVLSVNTNGSLIHKYLDLFKERPPSRINISLYGSDSESFRSLCKADKFSDVIENIKKLKALNIPVKINTVITEKNAHCCKDIINIAKELDVQISTTAYVYPQARLNNDYGHNSTRLPYTDAAKITVENELFRNGKDGFIPRAEKLLTPSNGMPVDTVRCRAGRSSYWITSDGAMRACGMLPELEARPLEVGFWEAWERVKSKTKDVKMPAECHSCLYFGICKACAAMCYAETGKFNGKPEYVCKLAEEIYRLTLIEYNKIKSGSEDSQ